MRRLAFWRRPEPEVEYDETLHEMHAASVELATNATKLYQAAEPFLNTENPLVAVALTLLHNQQERDRDRS